MSYDALTRGDKDTAAKLARTLERTWDAGEEHGGENSVNVRNPKLFEEIDAAMDAFVTPIIHPGKGSVDVSAIGAQLSNFVEKLKLADGYTARMNGVYLTRLGIYQGLAELSFQAVNKGDQANAKKIAMILARTWAQYEESTCPDSVKSTDPNVFLTLDQSMNAFVGSVMGTSEDASSNEELTASFHEYLTRLESTEKTLVR